MAESTFVKHNVCCVVIDGWGVTPDRDDETKTNGDAIFHAKTTNMSMFEKEYPYKTLGAHGLDVGLPDGLMGNSEVGHLNIGAGRIVYQVSDFPQPWEEWVSILIRKYARDEVIDRSPIFVFVLTPKLKARSPVSLSKFPCWFSGLSVIDKNC